MKYALLAVLLLAGCAKESERNPISIICAADGCVTQIRGRCFADGVEYSARPNGVCGIDEATRLIDAKAAKRSFRKGPSAEILAIADRCRFYTDFSKQCRVPDEHVPHDDMKGTAANYYIRDKELLSRWCPAGGCSHGVALIHVQTFSDGTTFVDVDEEMRAALPLDLRLLTAPSPLAKQGQ